MAGTSTAPFSFSAGNVLDFAYTGASSYSISNGHSITLNGGELLMAIASGTFAETESLGSQQPDVRRRASTCCR